MDGESGGVEKNKIPLLPSSRGNIEVGDGRKKFPAEKDEGEEPCAPTRYATFVVIGLIWEGGAGRIRGWNRQY